MNWWNSFDRAESRLSFSRRSNETDGADKTISSSESAVLITGPVRTFLLFFFVI